MINRRTVLVTLTWSALLLLVQAVAAPIPPPPPPPDGIPPSQVTLVMQADAPCGLSIVGPGDELKQQDVPAGATEIKVSPGEFTLLCSASDPAVEAFSKDITATAGQRIAVNIRLAPAIAKVQSARQQRCNAEADKNDPDGRFKAAAGATLTDSQTGLQWTQADNGKPVNWKQASRYCSAMKNGWRLPTVDELSQLYSSCVSQQCFAAGRAQFSCHVSSRFHLTGISYWSSQPQDSSMALAVDLDGDAPTAGASISADADEGERVLCVRQPS